MAIIRSLAVGKGVKSAGNLTYKTIKGRCIASERITRNSSNTEAQQAARYAFKLLSRMMMAHGAFIDVAFKNFNYGSAKNEFARKNTEALVFFKEDFGGKNYEFMPGAQLLHATLQHIISDGHPNLVAGSGQLELPISELTPSMAQGLGGYILLDTDVIQGDKLYIVGVASRTQGSGESAVTTSSVRFAKGDAYAHRGLLNNRQVFLARQESTRYDDVEPFAHFQDFPGLWPDTELWVAATVVRGTTPLGKAIWNHATVVAS